MSHVRDVRNRHVRSLKSWRPRFLAAFTTPKLNPQHSFLMSTSTTLPSRSASTRVDPLPQGMHTVTPHLVCAGAAEAIDFYQRAFGAKETSRIAGQNGK